MFFLNKTCEKVPVVVAVVLSTHISSLLNDEITKKFKRSKEVNYIDILCQLLGLRFNSL
jgi:hypothetical protein